MAGFLFLIAIVLGGAALLFRHAAEEIRMGTSWAVDVCSTSTMFCHDPQYLAYAGVAVLIIACGFKLGSLASN